MLLRLLDERTVEADDVLTGDEVGTVGEGYAAGAGMGLEGVEGRHDEGADELALVGYNGALLDVGVAAEAHLDRLRGDVFAVRGLEEILDALLEEERAAVLPEPTRVAGAEVSVGREGAAGLFGLTVILAHDGLAADKDLVVLRIDTDVDVGHEGADGAEGVAHGGVAADGGGGFGEAIAVDDGDVDGEEELGDLVREGRAGYGEDVAALDADGAFEGAVDRLLVEGELEGQRAGRRLARAAIVEDILAAGAEGVTQEALHRPGGAGEAFVGASVDLFPEARHVAHERGPHLEQRLADHFRVAVDGNAYAAAEAEVGPSLLEDVDEW